MHPRSVAATLLLVCAQSTAVADNRLPRVEEIGFREVTFESSLGDAFHALPTAARRESAADAEAGLVTLEVRDDPMSDAVLLRFDRDGLMEIKWVYFPSTVAAMGGAQGVTALAIQEYGPPTSDTGKAIYWDLPAADRVIVVSDKGGSWTRQVFCRSRRLACEGYADIEVAPKKMGMHVSRPLPPTPTTRGPRSARVSTYSFGDSGSLGDDAFGDGGATVEVVENLPAENPLVAQRRMAKKKKEFCIIEFMEQAAALRGAATEFVQNAPQH